MITYRTNDTYEIYIKNSHFQEVVVVLFRESGITLGLPF